MKKNFALNDDSISFQIANHYFDVHNGFHLCGLEIDFIAKQMTIRFSTSNTPLMDQMHEKLTLLFRGVDFLTVNIGNIGKINCDVAELGYKQPDDFDHDWLMREKNCSSEAHLFIRFEGDEFIRIHGETVELTYV